MARVVRTLRAWPCSHCGRPVTEIQTFNDTGRWNSGRAPVIGHIHADHDQDFGSLVDELCSRSPLEPR
jgi:hypothetical protein